MAERITVIIDTGTTAFDGDPNREVVRILLTAAAMLKNGHEERPLRDADGNVVGSIKITPTLQP